MIRPSHPLLAVFAFLAAWSVSAAADGDQTPEPKPVADQAATAITPPLVVLNPDGTLTFQKDPPKGDDKAKKGLVIRKQAVVPFIPLPEKRH